MKGNLTLNVFVFAIAFTSSLPWWALIVFFVLLTIDFVLDLYNLKAETEKNKTFKEYANAMQTWSDDVIKVLVTTSENQEKGFQLERRSADLITQSKIKIDELQVAIKRCEELLVGIRQKQTGYLETLNNMNAKLSDRSQPKKTH